MMSNGLIGLSPTATRAGDIVVVLLGSPVPLVLRPSPEISNGFRLIGGCYVDSIATGEMILGPLPEHVDLIKLKREDWDNYKFFFHYNERGEISERDPRHESLLGDMWWERPEFRNFDGGNKIYLDKVAKACIEVRNVKLGEFHIL